MVSLITLLPDAEYTQEKLAIKLKELCMTKNMPHVPIMKSLRILLTGQKVIFYYIEVIYTNRKKNYSCEIEQHNQNLQIR